MIQGHKLKADVTELIHANRVLLWIEVQVIL